MTYVPRPDEHYEITIWHGDDGRPEVDCPVCGLTISAATEHGAAQTLYAHMNSVHYLRLPGDNRSGRA